MDIKQDIRIKVESEQYEDVKLSEELALRLKLPPPTPKIGDAHFYFVYHNSHLHLFLQDDDGVRGPLSVDFLSGPVFYRYLKDRRINQPLARAAGIKKGVRPTICDVTAGFGADSFVFASLGCQVTMIERSPIVWALLDDGIRRALCHPAIREILAERVSLHLHEAVSFLHSSQQAYDTIYMDPMYPQQKKSALNKQEMRLLRSLVGNDTDSALLLQEARKHALKRVVVKRPTGAPFLEKPSFSVTGKSSRFDVFLTTHL